ncbi:MAG: hypothetical protein ACRDLN_07820 [Solirubrobacteraceae bacterium]
MVSAALLRHLRRRAGIVVLVALLAGPSAAANARPRDDSRRPWATVNVCDTAAAPNTIGIRASMPGSRSGQEEMYMRFVVQYFSRADEHWHRIAASDSGYLYVGRGRRPRQFGRSFRIEPGPGEPVLLRGLVLFQWRVKSTVVRQESARTRRGHRSNAGADPPGYSASTCTVTP